MKARHKGSLKKVDCGALRELEWEMVFDNLVGLEMSISLHYN
jgi:hypothetical protein